MKIIFSSSHLLLAAAGFFCLSTLHSGLVLAVTNPGLPVLTLRGGETGTNLLRVDREGNFYTPRRPTATKASPAVPSSPSVEALRGGSHHSRAGSLLADSEGNLYYSPTAGIVTDLRGGALCVDEEGNFYSGPSQEDDEERAVVARQGPGRWSAAAVLAASLRGGELRVDNEGTFFFARQPPPPSPPTAPTTGRRRSRGGTDDSGAIVFAKNDVLSSRQHGKKIRNKALKSKINGSSGGGGGTESPMAFIGYNNMLMET